MPLFGNGKKKKSMRERRREAFQEKSIEQDGRSGLLAAVRGSFGDEAQETRKRLRKRNR